VIRAAKMIGAGLAASLALASLLGAMSRAFPVEPATTREAIAIAVEAFVWIGAVATSAAVAAALLAGADGAE